MSDNKHISIIVPIKTTKESPIHKYRIKNWISFLDSIEQFNDDNFDLIVAYYKSDDILDILDTAKLRKTITSITDKHYNKSKANNQAAKTATGEILFFPDMDLTFPSNACEILRSKIKPGEGYWPIWWCEGGPEQQAMWRDQSYFVCGLTKADFNKMGGLNEMVAETWGGDQHTVASAKKANIKVIREKWPGVVHHYHPNNYRNFYHRTDDKRKYS